MLGITISVTMIKPVRFSHPNCMGRLLSPQLNHYTTGGQFMGKNAHNRIAFVRKRVYTMRKTSEYQHNRRKATTQVKRAFQHRVATSCAPRHTPYESRAFFCSLTRGVKLWITFQSPKRPQKWSITRRRMQVLCNEGRIPGLTKFGKAWAIPQRRREAGGCKKAKVR
jgi:hypothetical protein